MTTPVLKVALLGAGSVGSQTAHQLLTRQNELSQRIGAPYELIGIAVRNTAAARDTDIPAELYTTDAEGLIDAADIVIELIGGIEPAKTYVERALAAGKDVVTGNKALLSAHQVELFDVGKHGGAETYYEAAVAAAIPIIRPLQDSLVGDRIDRIMGIVNGSTNYILDAIDTRGITMEAALDEARVLGYLEADPTADVEGFDAASKATILAGLAFHTHVPADAVHREGITGITDEQLAEAKRSGFVVKLLAIAERLRDAQGAEAINVRVYPALVPVDHPLAAVHGGKNAVFVEAESAGDLMFYGAGAGGRETTSAILGDFVLAAKRIVTQAPPQFITWDAHLPLAPIDDVETRYQILLHVADEPGVLAEVTAVFARHGVSVKTLTQREGNGSDAGATLVIVTHAAPDSRLAAVTSSLAALGPVQSVVGVLRVEGQA